MIFKRANEYYQHYCPGCKEVHLIPDWPPHRWTFDGNYDKPTLTPSVKITPHTGNVCHYFITNGTIIYLQDCWHDLKGKTVPLSELSEDAE